MAQTFNEDYNSQMFPKVAEAEASGSVERHERLLDNLLEKVHENHHLTMRTKSQLISLYGNTPGLEYQVRGHPYMTSSLRG